MITVLYQAGPEGVVNLGNTGSVVEVEVLHAALTKRYGAKFVSEISDSGSFTFTTDEINVNSDLMRSVVHNYIHREDYGPDISTGITRMNLWGCLSESHTTQGQSYSGVIIKERGGRMFTFLRWADRYLLIFDGRASADTIIDYVLKCRFEGAESLPYDREKYTTSYIEGCRNRARLSIPDKYRRDKKTPKPCSHIYFVLSIQYLPPGNTYERTHFLRSWESSDPLMKPAEHEIITNGDELKLVERIDGVWALMSADEDICGLCGEPGADKVPHPEHWPGEQIPDTDLVHAECEDEECRRAHSELTDAQRRAVIRGISGY
jgi:hypothetical protein